MHNSFPVPLLLCGGQSSRMGSPKHLLRVPDSGSSRYRYLSTHLLAVLLHAFPGREACLSFARRDDALQPVLDECQILCEQSDTTLHIVYDEDLHALTTPETQLGPASGLLAAHEALPNTTFAVLACDYPFIHPDLLCALHDRFETVTCLRNEEGFPEPLVGIWSPVALDEMRASVQRGRTGPKSVVERLGSMVSIQDLGRCPSPDLRLFNANTSEEWETVVKLWNVHAWKGVGT